MTGFRITRAEPAEAPRQRRPRVEAGSHLAFIRKLPCVICGATPVDPAHLRTANQMLGKREVGVGEKPDDKWAAPLCRTHHDEQHGMHELWFWMSYGIDNPWQLCLALWGCTGDVQAGEAIVHRHRQTVRL